MYCVCVLYVCVRIILTVSVFSQKWPIQVVAVSLLVLIFSAKTLSRNSQWNNTDTLVHAGLKTNPGNAKLHMSMGNELAKQVTTNLCRRSILLASSGRLCKLSVCKLTLFSQC